MDSINFKKVRDISLLSVMFCLTVFLSLMGTFFSIQASSSRKLFDILLNHLSGKEKYTDEWMEAHPLDILILTFRLLKPNPFTKDKMAALFSKSKIPDPGIRRNTGTNRSSTSGTSSVNSEPFKDNVVFTGSNFEDTLGEMDVKTGTSDGK